MVLTIKTDLMFIYRFMLCSTMCKLLIFLMVRFVSIDD